MRSQRVALTIVASVTAASLSLFAPISVADDDDNKRSNVGAAFGRGLNSATPGNPVNHAILPKEIKVKAGGVVNFAVAGFHDIIIFKPGFRRADLDPYIPTSGAFIFPRDPAAPLPVQFAAIADQLYYRGINPAGGPPPGNPFSGDPSNGSNRAEPVTFAEKGTYLVICNVRTHLLDGMFAYVRVSD